MFALLLMMLPAAQPAAQPGAQHAARLHPTMTEVLYAVPREGDANKDGVRSATGDEFIELVNPHSVPINLKGYQLRDARTGPGGERTSSENGFRFTFPDLVLKPGEVVVVFNGFESSIPGPVGTREAAAPKNPSFNNAYVFTALVQSKYVAFANDGDCVTLYSPDATAIECVYWGAKQQPDPAAVQHKAPESRGSVQRASVKGEFLPHQSLPGPAGDLPFSPGVFEITPEKK
jgi:hypothetical protein